MNINELHSRIELEKAAQYSRLEEAARQALEALELALRSHGVMLLSDPPQEAWKAYSVEDKARDAITALRTALEQAAAPEVRKTAQGPCKYPRCPYPCPDLPDCKDDENQKPVAYAVYHRMGGSKTLHWPEQHSEHGDAKEYKLVPLYTTSPNVATPLAAQPALKPLTDEQAQDIVERESWGPDALTLNHQLLRTIRRTEAAHGITGETK